MIEDYKSVIFVICFFAHILQGYETTATAATNVCALLAIYPDTQQKLFEEIRSVLPDQESDVTQEDIKNMPYLDAFTKESLRFFPVVPVLTRILNEDMSLGEVTIPKGTEYVMDIWNMHRMKSNWKFDATKFNPENFFPQNAVERHPYSYIPFSAGPRSCIGMYARILMITFVPLKFNYSEFNLCAISPFLRYEIWKYCIEIDHRPYRS